MTCSEYICIFICSYCFVLCLGYAVPWSSGAKNLVCSIINLYSSNSAGDSLITFYLFFVCYTGMHLMLWLWYDTAAGACLWPMWILLRSFWITTVSFCYQEALCTILKLFFCAFQESYACSYESGGLDQTGNCECRHASRSVFLQPVDVHS
jgi:hypothetical protein